MLAAHVVAQDSRAAIEAVEQTLGATRLTSIEARLELATTPGTVGDFILAYLQGFAFEHCCHREDLLDLDLQSVVFP